MGQPRPPRLARYLVTALVREPMSEILLGDLEEQYARAAARSRWRARTGYWRQALALMLHRPAARTIRATGLDEPRRRFEMSTIVKDFILGVRTSLRSPGYSTVTILTLALAIGANTLLFSIANPLLVRSLPLEDPDRLGWIMSVNPEREITRAPSSMPDFLEWRAGLTSFSALSA